MCFVDYHTKMAVIRRHMQPPYTRVAEGNQNVREGGFLQISRFFFVHLDNKDTYSIFKDKLYSLCFSTNKLLFMQEIFKFVQKLFTFVVKVVLKIKYLHKNWAILNSGLDI
jgi:hypothetical protein